MQLVRAGVFPAPLYDVATRRPFYSEDLQAQCLEVRQRNVGINGRVVMFYSLRPGDTANVPRAKRPKEKPPGPDRYAGIVDGLKALGLVAVTAKQVAEAVGRLFPEGTERVDPGKVIRAAFVHLHGNHSGRNVGRKE
jgi:hypothetical protein